MLSRVTMTMTKTLPDTDLGRVQFCETAFAFGFPLIRTVCTSAHTRTHVNSRHRHRHA